MAEPDKRKQSLYFPKVMLQEIEREALRQDRSKSWIVQQAWKRAKKDIQAMPAVNDIPDDEPDDESGKVD